MFYENPSFFFQILGVFYAERPPRDVVEKNRSHSALSFRRKGSSSFLVNDEQLPAGTGAVTYIPAGFDYRHTNTDHEEIFILHLSCPLCSENSLQIIPNAQNLEPLFERLLETWEEGSPNFYNRCMALVYQIFEYLQPKSPDAAEQLPPSIAAGVEMLRKNFRDPKLTVPLLAEQCFVSEVYFRRVYHSCFGESPLQTIRNLRFQYACSLLRSGYYTSKQIAELAGFSDVKYFRTAFKKQFGKTPLEFASN